MSGRRYRIGANVVGDVVEGEALIINLERGIYYTLGESGAEIWEALRSGVGADEVERRLLARYEGDPAEIASALDALITELERDGVLVAEDAEGTSTGPPAAEPEAAERRPFTRPVVQRYDDMEEILLLDPIHDVDPTGWPARPGD